MESSWSFVTGRGPRPFLSPSSEVSGTLLFITGTVTSLQNVEIGTATDPAGHCSRPWPVGDIVADWGQ